MYNTKWYGDRRVTHIQAWDMVENLFTFFSLNVFITMHDLQSGGWEKGIPPLPP